MAIQDSRPNRRRCDLVGGTGAGVGLAAGAEEAFGDEVHIVIAGDLATEAQARERSEAAGGKDGSLGLGDFGGFTGDEFHTAGGAAPEFPPQECI